MEDSMKALFLSLSFLALTQGFAADVDLKKSQFTWKGTKVAGEHVGHVSLKSATLDLKEGKLTGGEFVIDLATMTTTDLSGEWADKLVGHLKSGDFFNIEKFPTASLKVKSVKGNKVEADLTIKGKTNPVSFDVTQKGKEYSGKLVFDRTKFDMVYNSGNFFKDLGDKAINNDVSVDFKVVAK
jgi:polyisoprenoid-binding protein YceI